MAATGTTKARRHEDARSFFVQRLSSCVFARVVLSWSLSLQRPRETIRALAVADDCRHARAARQVGAAIDRRHGQVELRTFGAPGQRYSNWMEQRLTFLTRAGLHPVRRLAKFLPVEPRRRRQLLGERLHHRPR